MGLIDLAPTILELVDRRPPASMQGSSLMPLIRDGDAVTPRYVFMEAGYHEPTQLVVRRGRYKLVHFRAVEDRPRVEGAEFQLFDLAADPGELRSVVDEYPEIVAELKGALAEWLRTTPRAAAAKPEVELDAASRRLLNALGYTR